MEYYGIIILTKEIKLYKKGSRNMKRQIRSSVFETNSSSTHAICITKDNYTNKTDYVLFTFGEFGWENSTYSSLEDKASYLITAIFSAVDKDYADEKLQQLKDILDENDIKYDIPTAIAKSWDWGDRTEFYYDIDGYIDHSYDTKEFVDAVLSDSDKLMKYLFGDSMIITGNDNGDIYSDRMYVKEGETTTKWGTYTNYGCLKPEFDNYEVYEKGN